MQVWPNRRTTNEKGSRKDNKINNFWFCIHSFVGKKRVEKKKRLCYDWIRERNLYIFRKRLFRKEKLVYQKNNNLFFPFGKDYPLLKGKNGKNLCLEKSFLKEINLI